MQPTPSAEKSNRRSVIFQVAGRLFHLIIQPMNRQRLANIKTLIEGESVKFQFQRDGLSFEGFAFRVGDQIVAYENRCRHLPLSLDYGDGSFFTRDGQHLICQSHGALYEPMTGLCVRGPCEGASLRPLKVELAQDALWLVP